MAKKTTKKKTKKKTTTRKAARRPAKKTAKRTASKKKATRRTTRKPAAKAKPAGPKKITASATPRTRSQQLTAIAESCDMTRKEESLRLPRHSPVHPSNPGAPFGRKRRTKSGVHDV